MKIIKKYQGTVPDNKILNTQSNSQTDTYSCDYINTHAIINDYVHSSDGYEKLPSGLIIEWGTTSVTRSALQEESIWIPFHKTLGSAYIVLACLNDVGWGYNNLNEGIGIGSYNNTGFYGSFKAITGVAHTVYVRYIVIGS